MYPELDLWSTAKPFLERGLKKQMGPRALLRKIQQNLPYWTEKLPEIPDLIYRSLQHYSDQRPMPTKTPVRESSHQRPSKLNFLSGTGIAFLLTAGASLWMSTPATTAIYHNLPVFTWIFGSLGIITLVWGLYSR